MTTKKGPQRTLSSEQAEIVVRRFIAGEAARTIAASVGVSYQTVLNTVKRSGSEIPRHRQKPRLDEASRQGVVETCLSGGRVIDAAEAHGTSPETVLRVLKQAGVSLPKGRPPRE